MVLGDFIRDLFSTTKYNTKDDESAGVTGLPRNIEDELAKRHGTQSRGRSETYNEEWSFPEFEIFIGPECDEHHRHHDEHHHNYDHHDEHHHDYDHHHDFFQMEHNMMRQLEDMMHGLFGGFHMHDVVPDFPQIEGPNLETPQDENSDKKSLREKMLKDEESSCFGHSKKIPIMPFIHDDEDDSSNQRHSMMDWSWTFPFNEHSQREPSSILKDKDFDGEVQSGKSNLDEILAKGTQNEKELSKKSSNGGFSFQKFSSVTTKRSADGIIESQKTVKDSEGNEVVTVIRKIGDQEHKKTTKKDSGGSEETQEDLLNMNEADLEKFEDAWTRSKGKGQIFNSPEWDSGSNTNIFPGRLHDSIKDFFFPWKRN